MATAPQDIESAESMVKALYSGEQWQNHTSESLTYILEQEHVVAEGEIGGWNANPTCDCQDGEITQVKMRLLTDSHQNDTSRMMLVAQFKLGVGKQTTLDRSIRYDLRKENGVWKIDDIVGPDSGSLRNNASRFIAEYGRCKPRFSPRNQ